VVFILCSSFVHTGSNSQAQSFMVNVPLSIGLGSHNVTISIIDEFAQNASTTLQFVIRGKKSSEWNSTHKT